MKEVESARTPIDDGIHGLSIQSRIDWVFRRAGEHSRIFQSPEAWQDRKQYIEKHPTAIVAFSCMDGRVNIPVVTKTPQGVISPFRNLGGRFDMGWPHLNEMVTEEIRHVLSEGRHTLALLTYHFSKGDPHRGCAGFDYDTDAACAHTFALKRQLEFIFGADHALVYPVVCGFETDEDALLLHGHDGEILDLSTLSPSEQDRLPILLSGLYPDMPELMRSDFVPLLADNISHIAEVKGMDRHLNIAHSEWMICIGRGFDWLRTPKVALIIGPYSPNLTVPIRKAAEIIETNMRSGNIPEDGFLLFSEKTYNQFGIDRCRAIVKSKFLSEFAARLIRVEFPWLAERMSVRTTVLAWQTRALELIDESSSRTEDESVLRS